MLSSANAWEFWTWCHPVLNALTKKTCALMVLRNKQFSFIVGPKQATQFKRSRPHAFLGQGFPPSALEWVPLLYLLCWLYYSLNYSHQLSWSFVCILYLHTQHPISLGQCHAKVERRFFFPKWKSLCSFLNKEKWESVLNMSIKMYFLCLSAVLKGNDERCDQLICKEGKYWNCQ